MEPNQTNKLQELINSSIEERTEYLEKIKDKQTMSDEELAVVRGLFDHFYETDSEDDPKYEVYEMKENTSEYRYTFEVRFYKRHNNYCIHVIDTTKKNPTYPCRKEKLANFVNKTRTLKRIFRHLINDQIQEFRQENQNKMQPGIAYDVDHCGDFLFNDIADQFIKENGGAQNLKITLDNTKKEDGGYILKKGKDIFNQKFKDFHKELAQLQLLPRKEHVEKTKQDQKKQHLS